MFASVFPYIFIAIVIAIVAVKFIPALGFSDKVGVKSIVASVVAAVAAWFADLWNMLPF